MASALISQVKAKMIADNCEKELWAGWNVIVDEIHKKVKKQKPLPKSFEVHHMNETARKAYLLAFVAGKGLDVAMMNALDLVGIKEIQK